MHVVTGVTTYDLRKSEGEHFIPEIEGIRLRANNLQGVAEKHQDIWPCTALGSNFILI
jgi:hypothetical protein